MRRSLAFAFVFSLTIPALAQSWSVSAQTMVPGTATATVFSTPPVSQTITHPIGQVNAGTFLTAGAWAVGGTSSANATAQWVPSVSGQTAPLAFTAATMANAAIWSTTVFHTASATLSAQVDFVLRAPAPVSGRLQIQSSGQATFGQTGGSLTMDVGADGTIEVSATIGANGIVHLPVHIPAAGLVVRIQYQADCATAGLSQRFASLVMQTQFFPGEPAVHVFDTTGAGAALAIAQNGHNVTLSMSTVAQTPLLIAFGLQPMVNPILPTVTQLVSLDAVFPVGSLSLTLPTLAPGTAVYAQGLVDAAGTLRSTNSVRALWP